MAGFTLSGGFHFDPSGVAETPAGIKKVASHSLKQLTNNRTTK